MPIYEYHPQDHKAACDHCRGGFDHLQKISEPPLSACPECGCSIERRITPPNVQSGKSHLLKEKNFAEKGFTQYKKLEKGVYEKTAGKGPDIISDK